ncbi:MAG: hypothetical protein GC158_05125 [Cyanobacteria bacterium RI_101]|nr:hypothetical protein [Cyanobacteria bacterium RI_101]
MPFILIQGRFKPQLGRPDGDSVRFQAQDPALWLRLEGRKVDLSAGGPTQNTAQLRLEGIDSIEKEALSSLAEQSKASLLKLIGFDAGSNPEPEGYILSRSTDGQAGRPVSFAFSGPAPSADGASVFLDPALLQKSVNYGQTLKGFAYPLYYDTLFADLRRQFNAALEEARQNQRGYWPADASLTGVTLNSPADLATIPPIWPKLWRRLREFAQNGMSRGPDGTFSLERFLEFLKLKNERVDIISAADQTGLHHLVAVAGNTVKLLQPPENIRVVSRK